MELNLNNLKTVKSARKAKRRVGRGNASGRGTYSARGQKGQRSRSGGKGGLKQKGLMSLLRNKPKLGGFNSGRVKFETVNLDQLENIFENGEVINAKKMLAKNLIKSISRGVKVLGQGKLTKKLTVIADSFSSNAKQAIIEAGGKPELRVKKSKVVKSKKSSG